MTGIIKGILGLLLICTIVYGSYWVCKTVSYAVFYEDMVQDTVRELVKQEALR